ncbi:DUF4405 domain-containing protein [Zavarzinia compransoris]|uniref:DUF4405 domain-containing protein n=1 Tax=Zavarzinia compransoris TaxID=1264899 RepID=A0A317EAW8_9PROT|nr:DUF4405 domain-containing protein [Zavarzinia compransoris]PWR23300.1 DUF4405 domain-containing protein [Zavarzinia compransoris]TDP46129.1 hypothetical protein DES42_104215 [Zavarzinia compransoris]
MGNFINRYATPLTTGLFVVSAVSGLALLFGWAPRAFHGMHEWLSLVLLLPFGFHVARNWRPLVAYAKRKTLFLPLALSLVLAAPFAVAGLAGGPGGNPAFRALPLLAAAPLSDLAPILKTTPEALIEALKAQGLNPTSPQDTPAALAAAAGRPVNPVLIALMPAP